MSDIIEKLFRQRVPQIDRELKRLLPKDRSSLSKAMCYSMFAGGKRFRPVLAIESALCCGGEVKDVLSAACAIEMIHTFTLIHDDLPAMDDSELRRGKPTCHKVFGEDIAVLAGDALNTLAFFVIAQNVKTAKVPNVTADLSSALIKVVYGQVMDLEAEGKKVGLKELQQIHLHKTSALIEVSAKIGAVLANANDRQIKAVTSYARHMGLAFQIADDILDAVSTEAALGKPSRADAKLKKATYPAVLGVPGAEKLARDHLKKAVGELAVFGKKGETLRALAEFTVRRNK
ncbi:MAG TPA: farnesyl diphosphate synthase [Candidatus Omnitrophota bacterium]|nr:farnesyl diphosphate synthase [Candidatus Omnitrophota bacterium]